MRVLPCSRDESCWRMQAAPSPEDLQWPSLRMRLWEVRVRRALVAAAFWLLVLTYFVPVTAVQVGSTLALAGGQPACTGCC
jgi:hypothetical protein